MVALAILGYAINRALARRPRERFQQLQGWQKLLGFVALLAALLMIVNPEFLALGLVGDAAFFDALVLLLSLQLQALSGRAWQWVRSVSASLTRILLARLAFSAAVIVAAVAPIGNAVSAIRKALQNAPLC